MSTENSSPEDVPQGQTAGGKALIFVVDDEPTIANTLAAILKNSGFAVEAFLDPLDALRALETRCPDIVIADVLMPHLSGIELGVRCKAKYPECRVILLSGQLETRGIEEAGEEKGIRFTVLLKPVHPKEILATIRATADNL